MSEKKKIDVVDNDEATRVVLAEDQVSPVIYIFLNKSLGMSAGKAAAQAAHAAVFATSESGESERNLWRVSPHKTIIVLEARDEAHIKNIRTYLDQRGIRTNMIIDEGVNEIDPHTITALSSSIVDKNSDNIKLSFSTFSLYRDMIEFSVKVTR